MNQPGSVDRLARAGTDQVAQCASGTVGDRTESLYVYADQRRCRRGFTDLPRSGCLVPLPLRPSERERLPTHLEVKRAVLGRGYGIVLAYWMQTGVVPWVRISTRLEPFARVTRTR